MSQVHLGEYADIHLAGHPNRVLKGRIGNILPIIDPNIRTAKAPSFNTMAESSMSLGVK
jgi:hypothetical protein